MITLNNNIASSPPISTANYSTHELSIIKYRDIVVWSKQDELITLYVGDDFIIGNNIISNTNKSTKTVSKNGFTIESSLTAQADNKTPPYAFNRDIDTGWSSKTSTTTIPRIKIVFPFDIYIQSITLIDKVTTNTLLKHGKIYFGTDLNNFDTTTFINVSRTRDTGNSVTTTVYDTNDSIKETAYKAIRIVANDAEPASWGVKASQSDGDWITRTLSEVKMEVKVSLYEFLAWKNQYNLTSNNRLKGHLDNSENTV